MTTTPLIRLEAVSKSFGSVQANKAIDLDIRSGRILALLGENGAGKSTLMSILAGRLQPDSGRILVEGEPVDILVNETLIAKGEVIVQNEKYGIRVTEITSRLDRIRSFSI